MIDRTNTSATAASECVSPEVVQTSPRSYVQNFVVYPGGYGRHAPEPGEPVPVFFLEDDDLRVVTNELSGRSGGGTEDGIVCVIVNQDESCHEVRLSESEDEDRVQLLTHAIEQLTIVRDQLKRLQAVTV